MSLHCFRRVIVCCVCLVYEVERNAVKVEGVFAGLPVNA